MKREEEIINAGVEYTESRKPMCIGGQSYSYEIFQMNRNYAFEAGAKWADKTMIERACEWLDSNFPLQDNVGSWYKEGFIKQFKKAMKGE